MITTLLNWIKSTGLIYLLRYTQFILNQILDTGIKMPIKQSWNESVHPE
jgi:hypothetical protein